jgi:hypothetical protein
MSGVTKFFAASNFRVLNISSINLRAIALDCVLDMSYNDHTLPLKFANYLRTTISIYTNQNYIYLIEILRTPSFYYSNIRTLWNKQLHFFNLLKIIFRSLQVYVVARAMKQMSVSSELGLIGSPTWSRKKRRCHPMTISMTKGSKLGPMVCIS